MKRILMPGGICAFTVWKHLPWLEILAKAIKEEYPKRPMPFPCHEDAILSLTRWNRWHDPEWIKKTIQEAGFTCIPDNKEDENGTDDDEGRTQNVGMNDKDEDWSQYEFNSGQSRSLSRKNSRTSSPTPSMETDSSATPTQSNPIPSSLDPLETEESSILIEEVSSIHRYTKHEFMSNFGTSVLDHLISSSWGKQSISKEETRKELTEALLRYLIKLCPDQFDEIELEMKALVVIVRKVNKKDTSKHI